MPGRFKNNQKNTKGKTEALEEKSYAFPIQTDRLVQEITKATSASLIISV